MKNNFYITTPIYYVNDILIQVMLIQVSLQIAYLGIKDYQILMYFLPQEQMNTDKKLKTLLKKKNIDTLKFTDKVSSRFKDLCHKLNLSNNDFIRTTETRHKNKVKAIWNKLIENNEIYLEIMKDGIL